MRLRAVAPTLLGALLFVCLPGALRATQSSVPSSTPDPAARSPVPSLTVDVVAVDGRSRPVLDLGPDDLAVTVDGQPRAVRAVRYVRRAPSAPGPAGPPAVAVIVVDERMLGRATERLVRTAASRLVMQLPAQLGPETQLAVVRLRDRLDRVGLTTSRADLSREVNGITARAESPSELLPADVGARLFAQGENAGISDAIEADERGVQRVDRPAREGDVARGSWQDADLSAVATALATHGRALLDTLTAVAQTLGPMPGFKSIVVVSSGLLVDPSSPDVERLATALAAARATVSTVQVAAPGWLRSAWGALDASALAVPGAGARRGEAGLVFLARMGGGTSVGLPPEPARVIDALVEELSGVCVITVDGAESDATGEAHVVGVESRRAGVQLRARARWVARDDRADVAPRGSSTSAPTATLGVSIGPSRLDLVPNASLARAPTAAACPRACENSPETTTLVQLLACGSQYVQAFEHEFSSVVAEERLEQLGGVFQNNAIVLRRRITRADMLLVQDPAGEGWMPFRDVFEVDGRTLPERQDRLRRLFLEQPASALKRAAEIAHESARYNIGAFARTINVPTLPLLFLSPAYAPRFEFRKAGEEDLGGVRVWKVEYRERARPTLIISLSGANMPAKGFFWIDPRNGSVVASRIEVFEIKVHMVAVVTYAAGEVPGLLVPVEMREGYRRPDGNGPYVNTVAAYSNFRRFQVTTETVIKKERTR